VAEPFIAIVKLVSGEEVIAKVDPSDADDSITLIKPQIVFVNPQSGECGLIDFIALTEEDQVTIGADKVLYVATAKEGLAKGYKERCWGEKQIVKPSKKLVLPP